MNLEILFDSLEPPEPTSGDSVRFSAVPIPGCEEHRLGKDSRGHPMLLLSVAVTRGTSKLSPIVLKHLTVQHGVDCRILRPDGTIEEGRFTAIHCNGKDRVLVSYFLRVVSSLLTSVLISPSSEEVSEAIDRLVELFRAMTELPRKSVQGLWAELYCMVASKEPGILVRAWHAAPTDRYDFCDGNQRVEVKSASGGIRQHHFGLEQLHPPEDTTVLVASLFVERAGGGTCVADLTDQLRTRISEPALVLHLDRVIALTLGENWRSAIDDRFDQQLAAHSLAFYDAFAIPSLEAKLPLGVSDVRFKSDLTACTVIDPVLYRSQGGLFKALLTRHR